eukprot:PhM_4_TR14166/c3_g1_i1/m.99698
MKKKSAPIRQLLLLLLLFVVFAAAEAATDNNNNKGSVITADNSLTESDYIQVGNVTVRLSTTGELEIMENDVMLWSGGGGNKLAENESCATYIENGMLKLRNSDWRGFGATGVVTFTIERCSLIGMDENNVIKATTSTLCRGYDTKAPRNVLKANDVLAPDTPVTTRGGDGGSNQCHLVFQSDCNLVIYHGSLVRYATNTAQESDPEACSKGYMQLGRDGYLRTYNDNNQVVWHLGVEGSNPAALMLYECRILVIDRNEQQLYSGGRLCPNGQQGALYRKYLPNQDINAGTTTMMQSDLKDAQQ